MKRNHGVFESFAIRLIDVLMTDDHHSSPSDGVELPAPTAAPLVLALAVSLLALGAVAGLAFAAVGLLLLVVALAAWVRHLLPGAGHFFEPRAAIGSRPAAARPGTVEALHPGMPGYRFQLPIEVQPISAGVKGGLAGGLIMPLPAIIYTLIIGRGIWYPLNLLAGMVMPGVQEMTAEQLDRFHFTLAVVGAGIHVTTSLVLGLIYGVLLPMLPRIARPLAWGGLLAPLLWSAATYLGLGYANPTLQLAIEWPWFVVSQFVYGVTLAIVYMEGFPRWNFLAGALGGLLGGLVMPIPAVLWSLLSGHGLWYPLNVLAALVMPGMEDVQLQNLRGFHAAWAAAGVGMHLLLSLGFGLLLGLVLRVLPRIPAQITWGGLLMPILWTGLSYSLMGIVNPVLQENVDWPWFTVSQFVFGAVAALVVMRSEAVAIPPVGPGVLSEPTVVLTEDEGTA